MGIRTTVWRSLRVIEHLLTGAALALGIAAGRRLGARMPRVPDLVRWWHDRLCRALGVRLEVTGAPAPNALLVANHVSWLDIPVIGAQGQIGFLSKDEVRRWPLIGWMAGIAGTLFIARGANRTGALVAQIAARVSDGRRLAIFPEGTTTDGTRLQRFHPRLLAAGQLDGVRVQPVALRYGTSSTPDPVAPFVGDDALLPHLGRLVRHPGLRVEARFLPPLDGGRLSRRALAERCRTDIAVALGIDTAAPSPSDAEPQRGFALPLPEAPVVEAA